MARNYSNDLLCRITDTQGHELTYAFYVSTEKDRMVETGFTGNRKDIGWPEGHMPIWEWHKPLDGAAGMWLLSHVDPGWGLFLEALSTQNGVNRVIATLRHNTTTIGTGYCWHRDTAAPTAPAPAQAARSSGDSVALQSPDGRSFYLNVSLRGVGDRRFLLDTGATNMSVTEFAGELPRSRRLRAQCRCLEHDARRWLSSVRSRDRHPDPDGRRPHPAQCRGWRRPG